MQAIINELRAYRRSKNRSTAAEAVIGVCLEARHGTSTYRYPQVPNEEPNKMKSKREGSINVTISSKRRGKRLKRLTPDGLKTRSLVVGLHNRGLRQTAYWRLGGVVSGFRDYPNKFPYREQCTVRVLSGWLLSSTCFSVRSRSLPLK